MKKSLITITWNRCEQLRRGISTVINQEDTVDEIIIVDDGSTDNTMAVSNQLKDKAKEKGIELIYIYLNHPEARISSIPKNIGFKQSTGDIIFFTESEMLHVTDTIKQASEVITEGYTPLATQIWTMGQKIWEKLDEDYYTHPARILSHEYAQLTDNTNMDNRKAPDADWGITGSINCYAGCFLGCKRKWVEDIGGFDESMEGHGWEDWDFLHRLDKYGAPVRKCNDIIVIHQWHTKNYPYNTFDHAEKNGKISADRLKEGKYIVNEGKEWGII